MDFSSNNLFSSVDINPPSIFKIATISPIRTVIKIIVVMTIKIIFIVHLF